MIDLGNIKFLLKISVKTILFAKIFQEILIQTPVLRVLGNSYIGKLVGEQEKIQIHKEKAGN